MLLAGACTTAPETTTTTLPPSSETTASAITESRVYDVLALATHPNGAQLRVVRVEAFMDQWVVTGGITNGSAYGLSLDRGETQLKSDKDQTAVLLEPMPEEPIEPGEELEFTLRFGPLADPGAITLVLNSGGGSSATDIDTSSPTFVLGPIALDEASSRPPLPDPVPARRSTVSRTGVELQIEGINFIDNRIGVWARISNPGSLEATIAPTIAPSFVIDDLGNRYPLVLPAGQGALRIPPANAQSGVLSFAGRIHPDVESLSLGINAGTGGDTATPTTVYPQFIIEDIPLQGDSLVAPLPEAIDANTALDHPAGVRLEVERIAFTDTSIEATLTLTNTGANEMVLAAEGTYFLDDLGNGHSLVPPADNPQLLIEPGTSLEGTFVFAGRASDSATQVSLIFNASGSATDPTTQRPSFTAGPFILVRGQSTSEELEARVFAIGARSRLSDDVLATSTVDQITQTLTQFGATAVEGGFKLTLPQSILFDSASFELREDAAPALTLIADVLRFFEGDSAIVIGHTDSVGSQTYNQRLAEQRAQSVVDALVGEHGIGAERLTAEGRGEDEPIAPNTTPEGEDNPEGRQLNRRVEIVVLTDRELPPLP